MARYIPNITGPLVGSVGSLTFSKGRYGYYVKQKSNPTNPNTPLQAAQRQRMKDLVSYWKTTMTSAQSDAYEHAANLHKRSKWGSGFTLSGINLFVGLNTLLDPWALGILAEPTIFNGACGSVLPTISEDAEGKLQLSAWGETEPNILASCYFTNAVAQTIHYRNSAFVQVVRMDNTTVFPSAIPVVYPAENDDKYRVFWGIKFYDKRGAIAELIEGWTDGTRVVV